jgi:hypothetical protein
LEADLQRGEKGRVTDIMQTLGVSRAQVYLAKHRVGRALQHEINLLEKQLF